MTTLCNIVFKINPTARSNASESCRPQNAPHQKSRAHFPTCAQPDELNNRIFQNMLPDSVVGALTDCE